MINDEIELQMISLLVEWMHWNDAPREQFERLGLPAEGEATHEHLLCAQHYELVQRALNKQQATASYTGPGANYLSLTLQEIMTLPGGESVLRQHFLELIDHPDFKKMMSDVALQQVAGFMPAILSSERLAAFAADLAARTQEKERERDGQEKA